ncbi:MAG: SoxR reducing system RseC family protein [Clostridiaceae bacterium]|nr:SoxR reducing system RseC family protein [Clostridiaceae bacterium]
MRQCGTVTKINKNFGKVIIERNSSCGSCTACKMGHEDMKMEVDALNQINAKVGDRVELDMEGQHVLKAAFIVYVIPLIMLVIGLVLGNAILSIFLEGDHIEIYAAVIGFIFMTLAFVGIKMKEKNIKSNKNFTPVITAIIDKEEKI